MIFLEKLKKKKKKKKTKKKKKKRFPIFWTHLSFCELRNLN